MLLISRVLRSDVPGYRGMPNTASEKRDFLKGKMQELILEHFRKEEKFLFPYLEKRDRRFLELTDSLRTDHHNLKALYSGITKDDDNENILQQFALLLEEHIRKEERILFQMVQEILGEEELKNLQSLLEAPPTSQ